MMYSPTDIEREADVKRVWDSYGDPKDHIDILIERDDLNLDVYVYPEGKITIHGFTRNPLTALRVFLKIWSEIEGYVSTTGTTLSTPVSNP